MGQKYFKEVVGSYEGKLQQVPWKIVLLENGVCEIDYGGKNVEATCETIGNEVHIKDGKRFVYVFRIEPNGDKTFIAEIDSCGRENVPKEEQTDTLKKIK